MWTQLIARSMAFIDRSNIGNAKIAGMYTDLKLHGLQYNIAVCGSHRNIPCR